MSCSRIFPIVEVQSRFWFAAKIILTHRRGEPDRRAHFYQPDGSGSSLPELFRVAWTTAVRSYFDNMTDQMRPQMAKI